MQTAEAHLGEGTLVEVTAEGDTITVRPARYRHYKNLAEVLAEFKAFLPGNEKPTADPGASLIGEKASASRI